MWPQADQKSRITQFTDKVSIVPILAGNTIRLGRRTILARVISNGSLWEPELPDDRTLVALMTVAYGRRIAANDSPVRAIKFAARCLLKGDRAGAADALNAIRLDGMDEAGGDRLSKAATLLDAGVSPQEVVAKVLPSITKYDPDEPRIPAGNTDGGQWTASDGTDGPTAAERGTGNIPTLTPVAYKTPGASEADKQKFTDDHLAAAQYWADKLHVPVENILGLSAFESGWGKGPFAINDGNNFFSLYYPAPYATGSRQNKSGTVTLATFASYDDNLQSFVEQYGYLIEGVADPVEFASILQDAKKYGIDPKTGLKDPSFVAGVAATIRGFSARLAGRRI